MSRNGTHMAGRYEEKSNSWRGGKTKCQGYTFIASPNRHNGDKFYVREHIMIAEKALGKELPKGTVVHHVNGNKEDNRNENLVVCQDAAYHFFLHRRTDAFLSCGHTDWKKCWICKKYDSNDNLRMRKKKDGSLFCYHIECDKKYQKDLKVRHEQQREGLIETIREINGVVRSGRPRTRT